VVPGERRLLGITGAPAAGKSTVASALVAALHPDAVLVPMDGFHLAQRELDRLGRSERKGAPDTFDGAGFVALMRRLAAATEPVSYAPEFRREIEEPIAGAIAVRREVPLVVVEGNYLLLDEPPWRDVAPLLAETWYLDPDEATRIARLVARHMAFGRDEAQAIGRALGSDQRNAEVILASRARATVIV
jgi:pantothenate kinase